MGDGANDLAMIQQRPNGGLGVAYHAKPVVAAAAGAAIDHNDLTALLYLQGYTDEIVRGNLLNGIDLHPAQALGEVP